MVDMNNIRLYLETRTLSYLQQQIYLHSGYDDTWYVSHCDVVTTNCRFEMCTYVFNRSGLLEIPMTYLIKRTFNPIIVCK